MEDKQKNLIDAAMLGKIIDMYRLIADGADPFIFQYLRYKTTDL